MTYIVYQRTLTSDQVDVVNQQQQSPLAKAYFGLTFPNDDNAEECVANALDLGLYKQTMVINATDGLSLDVDDVFAAGNGHPTDGINVVSLQKHPSMSVGDIAVDLLENTATLCMPTGWKELNLTLQLI